jgi:hypothetical protein
MKATFDRKTAAAINQLQQPLFVFSTLAHLQMIKYFKKEHQSGNSDCGNWHNES